MMIPNRLGLGIALAGFCLTAAAENLSPTFQINGFATVGAAWVSKDYDATYLGSPYTSTLVKKGLTKDPTFNYDSVLGLQITYKVDEDFDLVGQLVSSGLDNNTTHAEWAYLAWRYNDNLRFRAGRIAFPVYMYSENLRVGQAYPWARLPVELYSAIPLTNMDGVDMLYRQPLADWNLDAQLYGGEASNDFANARNIRGLNLTLSHNAMSLHAGYAQALATLNLSGSAIFDPNNPLAGALAPLAMLPDVRATFTDVGATYDDGNWFAAGEYGKLTLGTFVGGTESAFASVGHYFGQWLPYVKWAKANALNGVDCLRTATPLIGPFSDPFCKASQQEQTSYSVGFRYDVSKHVSFKGELAHVGDLNGTSGFFTNLDATKPPPSSTNVFTFNVNASF